MSHTFASKPLAWTLLALVLAIGLLLNRAEIETDMARFMPDPAAETGLELPPGAGPVGRLLLMAIEGGDAGQRAGASDALVEALAPLPAVAAVQNGRTRIDDAELDALLGHRYLLSPQVSTERFSADALVRHLSERRADLDAAVPALPRALIPRDPTAESLALLRQLAPPDAPRRDAHGVWVSVDGQRALLVLHTHADGLDLDAQAGLLYEVRDAFQKILSKDAFRAGGLALRLSGPGVVAVQARDTIRGEVVLFSALASLALAGLLWWLFRSPRPIWLAALPLGSGILAGAALVTLVFGPIHGITLAFGVTILGVALDYPLHLFAHSGRDADGHDPEVVAADLWPALRLGAVSTALVYALMAMTGFTGMAQLGLFVLTGILVAAMTTRWLLPGLMGRQGLALVRLPAPRWLLTPPRSWRWGLAVLVTAALGVLISADPFPWEDDLAALNPVTAEQRRLDRELRTELKLPDVRHLLLLRSESAEHALRGSETLAPVLEELVAQGMLSGFDAPSRILPSQAVQQARQAALPSPDALRLKLRPAAESLGFRASAFEPFVADLTAARDQRPLTPDTVPPLLAGALLGLLMEHGGQWLALVPLRGVEDAAVLQQQVAQLNVPGLTLVDFKAISESMVTGFRDEALKRLAWGMLAVTLVLLLFTRNPERSLRVLATVGAGLVLACAALLLLGVRLSVFHLVGLLLVIGLCLDYAVFFSRPLREIDARRRNLGSVSVCALSTGLVFGLLALSQLPVLRALGLTVLLGVIFSFLAALVLSQKPFEDIASPQVSA